jgi:hypothetical protein
MVSKSRGPENSRVSSRGILHRRVDLEEEDEGASADRPAAPRVACAAQVGGEARWVQPRRGTANLHGAPRQIRGSEGTACLRVRKDWGNLRGEEFWAERRGDARLLDEAQAPLLLLALIALAVRLAVIFAG